MSIGVAIPCYKPHIHKLQNLLDSIERQTVLPDAVVVSCSSSMPHDFPEFGKNYSFKLSILVHNNRRNAAENRNMAVAMLKTDIVSFIDADDEMLPRRLEAVLRAYNEGAQLIVHNFTEDSKYVGARDEEIIIEHGAVRRAPSGCLIHNADWNTPIHHSQSSVAREVLKEVCYNEAADHERREDAVFCGDVAARGFKTAYIRNILTKYYPAGEWQRV